MRPLERTIYQLLQDTLEHEGLASLQPSSPLLDDGLGIDSIDVMNVRVALQRRFQVVFTGGAAAIEAQFASLQTLAASVEAALQEQGRVATGD